MVKVLPAEKTVAERQQEAEDRIEKASSDWWLIRLTGALGIVGILQFGALIVQAIVFRIQAKALRESVDLTRKLAGQQEHDMAESITQATRAATAMEQVGSAMTENVANTRAILDRQRDFAQRQMRAYIAVNPGNAARYFSV